VLTWRIRRARGPVALVLLGAGGVLGSLLARTVGSALASGHTTGAVSTVIHPPLSLHSVPMIWVQALVAIFSYMALAGLSSDPDLGAPPLTGTQSGPEGSGTGWDGAQAAQQR